MSSFLFLVYSVKTELNVNTLHLFILKKIITNSLILLIQQQKKLFFYCNIKKYVQN